MTSPSGESAVRAATVADVDAIAVVWHHAWRDAHVGHVPAALERLRTLDDFRARVPGHLATTTVATIDGAIVGLVTVDGDELEQIFLAGPARGTGLADALLAHGEAQIAERHERAWLAVVTGNARARRFYERNGWSDAGPIDYEADSASGPVTVATRRYEKDVRPRAG